VVGDWSSDVCSSDLTESEGNLDNYVEHTMLPFLRDTFQSVSTISSAQLLGEDAYRLSYRDEISKYSQIGTIKGDQIYYVEYNSDNSNYQKYLSTANEIIASLHIVS